VVEVACGDHHSCALTNTKEVFMWGSNKSNQLGFDSELYPFVKKPTKLVLHQYMNSAHQEEFVQIKAKRDYTVLMAESKNIYMSDKNSSSRSQFKALFGKQNGNNYNLKTLDNCYLAETYVLAVDQLKNIFIFYMGEPDNNNKSSAYESTQDKNIAI
jgi:alpha-tubulin suppressor-like RCC1 family protein